MKGFKEAMMAEPVRWYVLRVRHGFESIAASELRNRGISTFLPFRGNGERPRDIANLVFPGHVFARLSLHGQNIIQTIPGVLCIAGVPGPIPIDDAEMADLQAAVKAGLSLKVFRLVTGQQYGLIVDGPLRGRRGTFMRLNGVWHLTIRVMAVERTFAFVLPELSILINHDQRTMP